MNKAKSIVAAIGAVATILAAALADDVLSVDETGQIVSAGVVQLLTVLAVWGVRNRGYVDPIEASKIESQAFRRGQESVR